MMSRLNLLNQQSIQDSLILNETLTSITDTHYRTALIIQGISKDMDDIDPGITHDTSVAVQVTHGDKDAATCMKMNTVSGQKVEILEYDSTW